MSAATVLKRALRELDARLRVEVTRQRERGVDDFRAFYISDAEVDRLVAPASTEPARPPAGDPLSSRAALVDVERWWHISTRFQLSGFEQDVVLLALALELDLRYERIYGYLNDDATRRWPTRELALRLLAASAWPHEAERAALSSTAILFQSGMIATLPPIAEHPSWLAGGFALSSIGAHFLLGGPAQTAPLPGMVECVAASTEDEASDAQHEMIQRLAELGGSPVLVIEGSAGSGQWPTVHALARQRAKANDWEPAVLRVTCNAARAGAFDSALSAVRLHCLLYESIPCIEVGDDWFDSEGRAQTEVKALLGQLAALDGPTVLLCGEEQNWRDLLPGRRTLSLQLRLPAARERQHLWSAQLTALGLAGPAAAVAEVAGRFELTSGQIRQAARAVADTRLLSARNGALTEDELLEAARGQTRHALATLAPKVSASFGWDDLVLPAATLRTVREIAEAIRHRAVVYQDWGFARRVVGGHGLKVLFSGASGTGKTMTAAVIARELGLDLYAVDLSALLSKYIGETEKNLSRVFRAARSSSAILFFDEADALFAKRSEIKDAHDRYANVEVAHLLQKMEEHDGVVILATNLSRNLDTAFARRMHYAVEFPLPGVEDRERLWRLTFPPQAPLSDGIDFEFLARQFPIAGGDIRNVALDSAFLAAQDGRVITMSIVLRALARQLVKQGRTPTAAEFKHYFAQVSSGA